MSDVTTKAPAGEPQAGADKGGWTRERVELIRRTICPRGIGEDEFDLFIEQCKRSGLDPLLKEAFCVGRRQNVGSRDKPHWTTKYEFQPSEAGMLARAERFPDFKGIQASAVFAEDDIVVDQGAGAVTHRFNPAKRKGALVGAWARVVRADKLPVVVWLDFAGYVQQTPLWSKIPTTMIEKCARVAALRKAYPEAFGGLYVKEEMPAEEFEPTPAPERAPERTLAPVERPAPAAEAAAPAAAVGGTYELLGGAARGTKATFGAAPLPPREDKREAAAAEPAPEPARERPEVVVAFGPHKGRPARELSDDELSETIDLAHEKLMEQPKAKWAKAMRENLTALEAETEFRFRAPQQLAKAEA